MKVTFSKAKRLRTDRGADMLALGLLPILRVSHDRVCAQTQVDQDLAGKLPVIAVRLEKMTHIFAVVDGVCLVWSEAVHSYRRCLKIQATITCSNAAREPIRL